ncbi:MAG: hypothetical protein ACYTBJ_18335 [Planctomycetota bacterium]
MPKPDINHEKHERREKPDAFYLESEIAQKAMRVYKFDRLSLVAAKALFILGEVRGGLHHMRFPEKKSRDPGFWNNSSWFEYSWYGDLATYDFNKLTHLVLLSHEHCVRIAIQPLNFRYVRLLFHTRTRSGDITERHPTIEKAIESHLGRKLVPAPETCDVAAGEKL